MENRMKVIEQDQVTRDRTNFHVIGLQNKLSKSTPNESKRKDRYDQSSKSKQKYNPQ